METLFRLTLVRPPTKDKKKTRIKLEQKSQFQTALGQARQSANPREAVKTAARQFVATPAFVGHPDSLPISEQLEKLSAGLDALELKASVTKVEIVKVVEDAFGAKVPDLVKNKTLEAPIASLKDSIIAIKLLPEEHSRPIEELTNLLRDLEVILKVSTPQDFPGDRETLHNYRRRSALMPSVANVRSSLIPESRPNALQLQRLETEARTRAEAQAKVDRYKGLKTAYEELTSLSLEQLSTARQEAGSMVRSDVAGSLSPSTREILQQRDLGVAERSLDHTADRLRREMAELSQELDVQLGRPVHYTFKRVGNIPVIISTPMPSVWHTMLRENTFTIPDQALASAGVPQTTGKVKSVGVADLLVVKQHLLRYEGTDIAHIENVLKGEKKEREHTVRRETEEIIFRETETTASEENEMQSTTRNEMSRETTKTIKTEAELNAKVSVSAKYGTFLEASASVEATLQQSKQEATKVATEFARDVTQRSAATITERALERYSLRVTNEAIEKNLHSLDNVGGQDHISGVFQWVNKVYQAQMYNYGKRAMFDFMVPEPGAFLIKALKSNHASAVLLEKPEVFDLLPQEITEDSYWGWVKKYRATNITRPPEPYITHTFTYADWKKQPASGTGGEPAGEHFTAGSIQIEEGYSADHANVSFTGNGYVGAPSFRILLSGNILTTGKNLEHWPNVRLFGQINSVAWGVNSLQWASAVVVGEVWCKRTDKHMDEWRLQTHGALAQAYETLLQEYEEKLASLELQAGVEIGGNSPSSNLELIRDELRKNCISIMTEQYFDGFDALLEVGEPGADSIDSSVRPVINLEANERIGPYVRFFEQAFEWENMAWITYPYFWGRTNQWVARIGYDDPDPNFNQFLKAGYCRVLVPARPGFETAVAHFMETGEIWNGEGLPPVSSELYLAIADEIAERLERPGEEIPQGDSWEVTLPTDLVHLRADDKLPEWIQKPNGEWMEKTDRAQREHQFASV